MRYINGHTWCLMREDGEFILESSFMLDGQSYSVRVPIQDGRYLAQRVHELIIAPRIGARQADPAPVDSSEV